MSVDTVTREVRHSKLNNVPRPWLGNSGMERGLEIRPCK
jgi:hypothetical protein